VNNNRLEAVGEFAEVLGVGLRHADGGLQHILRLDEILHVLSVAGEGEKFIELMTSDRKLKASREGSKRRMYGADLDRHAAY